MSEEKEVKKSTRGDALAKAREAKRVKQLLKTEADKHQPVTILTESATPVPVKNARDIIWFGAVDLNPRTGKPSADYPGYYFDNYIAEAESDIADLENSLELDLYKGRLKKNALLKLDAMRKRLAQVIEAKPNLKGAEKDRVAFVVKDLGDRIRESMPCYSDMQRGASGNVDIEKEARLMVMPCIEVKTEEEANFFKQKGAKIVNGKVSRNDAIVAWKIMSKVLDTDTCDVESLRNQR